MVYFVFCSILIVFFFFKQKTAYEIMPSLVGSEMCIRDSFYISHLSFDLSFRFSLLVFNLAYTIEGYLLPSSCCICVQGCQTADWLRASQSALEDWVMVSVCHSRHGGNPGAVEYRAVGMTGLAPSVQDLRVGGGLFRHFGVHQFGFAVGEEGGAAVVAEFHREMVVEEEHVLDAGFAQHGLDFAGCIGGFVFGAEPMYSPHVLCVDTCLLYTSDAADDMQCVDLGGRRIIKKKKLIISITL
eukprot:TRINITY_DN7902_c0_g1_i1.p1 TRINITY_DN7902_c0_g1~~TRINITY_DN7902_c0_g1_i1.p1  ORF type:complete len:242 (+),score=28.93 TRINITY_DN7902_c0_g1_i1:53-778(+)